MYKPRNHANVWMFGLAALIVGVLSSYAEAQRSGRSGLRLGSVTVIQLLVLDDVQRELKLSNEQRGKLVSVHDQFVEQRRNLFSEFTKESGKRGPKLAEINKQSGRKALSLLNEGQQKRLNEILLQVNGAAELEKDKIAAALGITDAQKDELAKVRRANAKVRREARKKLEGSSSQTRSAKMSELQREADAKLLGVLTPKQRDKFKAMQGEKIALELYLL